MFDAFQNSGTEKGTAKRFVASSGIAFLVYVGVGGTVLVLAGTSTPTPPEDKEVEVTFEKELPKKVEAPPPPPPPPPPKPKKAPPPPPAAAAPPPPPGPPPVEAPKELPKEKPPEADPKPQLAMVDSDPTARTYGARGGVAGGVQGGVPGGQDVEAPPPKKAVYSVLPEEAEPPECDLSELPMPGFPEDMRAAGKEGLVILKVMIDQTGKVVNVQVMKGDEPFVGATLSVVKQWKCSPATLDGEAITAPKILRIPFKLGVGG